ncbi:MAG: hypothetical protein A2W91_01440 [Bacteroidetes bacterium GWF2_38_335]|nr:MAG: hypothetical protein A2W91_01440 [Bacteroidetes bacterium GWF2_38_335]OFY80938.1 MAG: hypothetical protein A2281_12825 [Bacteroidetes bacterium RIFOXYA12_FULL_38_20]HBS85127.1 hypothetical protein [Bacteroidales bacterium]
MEAILIYSLKSAFSMALLFAFYYFVMKRDTHFRIHRYFLVFSMLFSMIIPALELTWPIGEISKSYTVVLDEIVVGGLSSTYINKDAPDYFNMLFTLYLAGVTLFALRFVYKMVRLYSFIKKYRIRKENGINMVSMDKAHAPFSFFNFLFLNNDLKTEDAEKIVTHELVHVKQHHSVDIVIMELISVFQWFNPFVWMYRNSLKELHEYLADEGVLLKGYEKTGYQQLLLALTMGASVSDFANSFNQSLIKRRIQMMTKIKSGMRSKFKFLIALPLVTLLTLLFAFTNPSSIVDSTAMLPAYQKLVLQEKPIQPQNYTEVGKAPEFKGGQDAMLNYLISNIKYPKNAQEKGITGSVYVQFVVEKTGKISDVGIKKGVNDELDKEAVRVISSMPDWNPGTDKDGNAVDVEMVLPITFRLDEKKDK